MHQLTVWLGKRLYNILVPYNPSTLKPIYTLVPNYPGYLSTLVQKTPVKSILVSNYPSVQAPL